ncbi:MAG: efflux transporter outer membrane subunit [Desulfobacteraceae bacterium]|nr:MAG: efflux transporter outer membrane subunit [Desulfobacteraceae bacterium]
MNPEMRFITIVCLFFLVSGCAVGSDYKSPEVDMPSVYRSAASDTRDLSTAKSLADLSWNEVIVDKILRGYIDEALANSWDIKAAAARVLQAEAALRVTRSEFLPSVSAGGDMVTSRTSEKGPAGSSGADVQHEYGDVYVAMSTYELDLWGRVSRASESARARLLATEAAQDAVRQTLVIEVASTYLQLLQLDQDLEIGRRTLVSRTKSLGLTTSRSEGGVSSLQDIAQARILVLTAKASITETLRQMEQTENAFCLLLGRNPGPVKRGRPLDDHAVRTDIPAGLPSALLERRPDLRAAEQQLIAANADIGQAKAAFFPQFSLTGLYGFQSISLGSLFTSPAETWQFGPTVSVPLFTAGRLTGNYEFAKAQFEEAVALYQNSVQAAFRDVSDTLIAYKRLRELRVQIEELTEAYRLAADLANIRYEGGVASYLEVLYNEQELFDSELYLSRTKANELLTVIQLYRALGGGWQVKGNQKNDPGSTPDGPDVASTAKK